MEKNGRYLVAQRTENDRFGGLWEFPGGTLETGESLEACTKREMKEELGIEVKVGEKVAIFEDEVPDLKINVHLFRCHILNGSPLPLDCQAVRWVTLEELSLLPLAQVDQKILKWLQRGE